MPYLFRRAKRGSRAKVIRDFQREHPNLVVTKVHTIKSGVRPKSMRIYRIHYRYRKNYKSYRMR